MTSIYETPRPAFKAKRKPGRKFKSPRGERRKGFYQRFWEKVSISTGPDACWTWKAAPMNEKGYGFFRRVSNRVKSVVHGDAAHRVAWELANGRSVPIGMQVLHKCDNPPCCNPRHLFLGTNTDNVADRMAKGRKSGAPGERHGMARLKRDDVQMIHEAYFGGHMMQLELAEVFGVGHTYICKIIRGDHWTLRPE